MPPNLNLIQTFHPENIPAAISAFRPDGEIPALNERYIDGGQCRIFKVDFLGGESWSVRIPIHVQSHSRDEIIILLQREQDVLQEIGVTDFRWAPKHHGSSLTFDNLVGYPFIVLSWVEGSPLLWTLNEPSRPARNKILEQVAEMQMSLIERTKENSIFRHLFQLQTLTFHVEGSATAYFLRRIDDKIERTRNGHLPLLTERDCIDQKNILPEVLHPELENTPFAIDHGDLSPLNIIVDPEYNVTGIIDWGFASKVPFQLAARFPRFLQLQELVLPLSPTLQEDRKVYVASLTSQSSQVASWMSIIYSSDDIDFRHCFLESIISKGMHHSLAVLGWKLPAVSYSFYCELQHRLKY